MIIVFSAQCSVFRESQNADFGRRSDRKNDRLDILVRLVIEVVSTGRNAHRTLGVT